MIKGEKFMKNKTSIAMFSIHSSPMGELGTRDTGGMSVYIRELAQELGKQGHRVDIFTRHNHNHPTALVHLDDHVRLIHLNIGKTGEVSKFDLYPLLEDFFEKLEDFRKTENRCYDLIHSHYWLSARLGGWAQDRWNIPHIDLDSGIARCMAELNKCPAIDRIRVAVTICKHCLQICLNAGVVSNVCMHTSSAMVCRRHVVIETQWLAKRDVVEL